MTAIDLAELDAQTFGEQALAREILLMFRTEAPALMRALTATGGPARGDIAHRLKGSARAIGARRLAETAAALEESPDDAARLLTVETAMDAVLLDIQAILGGSG